MSVEEQREGLAESAPSAGAQSGRGLRAWLARTLESVDPALTPRFLFGSIGGLLLGAIALVILLRSGSSMDPVRVRLAGPFASGATSSADEVRIAVGSSSPLGQRFEHHDALARYLRERLARPVVVVQRRTGGEIEELLARGDAHAGVVCAGTYVHGRLRDVELEPIAVPVLEREPTYHSLVVVRRSSDIHSLTDLRGRSFAFTDPTSLAGYYHPVATLLDAGEPPATFFSRTVFTYAFDESLHAVRNGSVDAAAVDGPVLERDRWHDALRVVHRSPAYGVGPVVVAPGTSEDLRAALADAWLSMHESADGGALLSRLGVERFVPPSDGLYDSATLIVTRVERARGAAP